MECVDCGSAATSERRDRTAQGYRRFRCRDCGRQFNERSSGVLNRTQYPSDVIALVVLWRLRYRLTLQDLSEMFLERGIVFSYEAVRGWEAKLTPVLTAELRQGRTRTPVLARGRDISESPRTLVLPVSRHRPQRRSDRHYAQRTPGHGSRQGLLPLSQVGRRHDA